MPQKSKAARTRRQVRGLVDMVSGKSLDEIARGGMGRSTGKAGRMAGRAISSAAKRAARSAAAIAGKAKKGK